MYHVKCYAKRHDGGTYQAIDNATGDVLAEVSAPTFMDASIRLAELVAAVRVGA